ncbi:MAG TPA: UDP-N-acetylmuramoyl-tripeptide--D-alanyl-D-alanine ligase [Bacillota bacterium]|nr:UDP-N-acetylmuramoyl-tripeptide--D-alanyl-D-alanine ligase [Bacillota bacterium]
MKPLKIEEIVKAIDGRLVRTGKAGKITGVSTDTRTIKSGDLFIPLAGERFDGHRFMEEAATRGASAILTQELNIRFPKDIHIIYTNNTLKALQALSSWHLNRFATQVVAITGSTGKTTTKDMVYEVLSVKHNALKTLGNYNNEIGLPLTLLNLDRSHDIAVLEMGMSDLGEISCLVQLAPPKLAIITNVGVSHIERLGSRENILKAKLEVVGGLGEGATAIINSDDDLLQTATHSLACPVIRFGTKPPADLMAQDIQLTGDEGMSYSLRIEGKTYEIKLNVPGVHNVYNSLAAIGAGRAFGLTIQEIQEGLLKFKGDRMRLNISTIENDVKVINDSYNASPDSMMAALNILGSMEGSRKIAILGDMLELGDYSKEAHKQVGRAATNCGIDILVTRGQFAAWTMEGATSAGMSSSSLVHLDSNGDIITWLEGIVAQGDRILIKGSRGMHMEEIAASLQDGRAG